MGRYILVAIVAAVIGFAAVMGLLQLLAGHRDGQESGAPAAQADEAGDALPDADSDAEPAPVGSQDMPALLANAAEQVNAEAPIRIDQVTTLTRATTRGNRIRYRYEVSGPVRRDELEANRERMAATTRRDVCTNDIDRQIIAAGAEIEFAYYGTSGEYYFSTIVDRC